MIKYQRLFFWFLIVITILAILIDLPKNIPIVIKLPFNNKPVVNKIFQGFNLNFLLAGKPIQKDFDFRKGLDLAGGTSVILRADMQNIPKEKRNDALEGAKTVIEKRINLFGVSEPVIQTSVSNNDYRIVVDLPGVNVDQAVSLIGKTAQLSFWEESNSSMSATTNLPLGMTQIFTKKPIKTNLTGSDLQDSSVTFDQSTGKPQVQLLFTTDGAKKFAEITKRNVNKIVAIALDNEVIEAPKVNEPILGGNAVITGSFTTDQAKALGIQLKAGALPVSLSVLQQSSIQATLGMVSLRKSLFAGFIAFLVIVVFMIFLYGRLGMLASLALMLYTIFVLAIFKAIPVTLTLAGIAGFILSIGMAVDANILIFERMREELRKGRKYQAALELGFSRAWTSIRDSNISTLITCGVLFKFGTGTVRGFALTLAIGVFVSMFSAILVTRTFLRMVYKKI